MSEKIYTAQEFATKCRISDRTLYRLEENETLIPMRKNKRRYYTETQFLEYLGQSKNETNEPREVIVYSRVSSSSQKGELKNQTALLEQYVSSSGKITDRYLSDIGSGINFKRKNFLLLIDMIIQDRVSEVIITYEDRLVRFAYELIEHLCRSHGTKITVMNAKTTSPQEELIEDLMTIIHVFSARLYGLRQYKTKLKKALCASSE
jgi:predicted site-specific integrase-resolvase